ncbi:hypothetical protein [Microbacterium sp. Marseille-Q6648]|uniref:hypothetical protein n=1 Tax=Microbacterium sp. Marseille-Q6648 TaxID=2937991 RepID=UPI00203C041D|nr:hypothetical protein [Microbacterium sp. Marseille-Q6648]
MLTNRRTTASALTVLALLLAGCAASVVPGSDAAPTQTVGPTSSPTPTHMQGPEFVEPTSRFDFDCDDIADDVAPLFADGVPTPATMPKAEPGPTWRLGPGQYAFAQDGAVYCDFAVDPNDAQQPSASVVIVADGAGAVEHHDEMLNDSCAEQISEGAVCNGMSVVEGTYLQVFGTPGPEVAADEAELRRQEVVKAVSERVRDSTVREQSWSPPAGTIPLVSDCETVLPSDGLASVRNAPGLEVLRPDGGWSVEWWMLGSRWQVDPCLYVVAGAGMNRPFYGEVSWLTGGEWAYDEAVAGTELSLEEAEGSDRAALTCGQTPYVRCVVDVVAGGNWVRYQLDDTVSEEDVSRVATDIAEVIVKAVRGG